MSDTELTPGFITKVGNVLKLIKKAQNEREIKEIDFNIAAAVKLSEEDQKNHFNIAAAVKLSEEDNKTHISPSIEVSDTNNNEKVSSVACNGSHLSDENNNFSSDFHLFYHHQKKLPT